MKHQPREPARAAWLPRALVMATVLLAPAPATVHATDPDPTRYAIGERLANWKTDRTACDHHRVAHSPITRNWPAWLRDFLAEQPLFRVLLRTLDPDCPPGLDPGRTKPE